MSRLLLHPLEDGGNVTRVPAGQWAELRQPDNVAQINLTEAVDPRRRGRISSVPSPWARMQIVRDAVLDPKHPYHDQALNDILDSLELVLFQQFLAGVQLHPETIVLDQVLQQAKATHNPGIERFAAALADLAPEVERSRGTKLGSITVVRNGSAPDAPILFATSPFTLFFTPETLRWTIPGYFTGPGPLRPLASRPPALARYVRQRLLPSLAEGPAGRASELQKLKSLLEAQAQRVAGSEQRYEDLDQSLKEVPIEPAPGVTLHRLTELPGSSDLAIKPKRQSPTYPRAPLLLDNSGRSAQARYFPWLARPDGTTVDPATNRDVLPSTGWRYGWLYPETDFLADKLLLLDTPAEPARVHVAGGDAKSGAGEARRTALQVLLPLKPLFFEFFGAENVPDMLDLRVTTQGGSPRVTAILTIDTVGGPMTVQKEYAAHSQLDSYLSLWPGFVPKDDAVAWHDYYLMHHMSGGAAREEVAVDLVGSPGTELEFAL